MKRIAVLIAVVFAVVALGYALFGNDVPTSTATAVAEPTIELAIATPTPDPVIEVRVEAAKISGDLPAFVEDRLPKKIEGQTEFVDGEWDYINAVTTDDELNAFLPKTLWVYPATQFDGECSSLTGTYYSRPGDACTIEQVENGNVTYTPVFDYCTWEQQVLECHWSDISIDEDMAEFYFRYDTLHEVFKFVTTTDIYTLKLLEETAIFFGITHLPEEIREDTYYTIYPPRDN